ncbi:MAG TPA: 3-deoxy-8-phosphooctulonate synthase [Verrucomicrobiales bacterium]|jgi:2-dehydro-3-deoxyphosphooctonate aldolase (KDO 8-P synthase)|nr:3-deoxy-8-phosphooctulonate synthase [Verrucomicrobiales bacterium]
MTVPPGVSLPDIPIGSLTMDGRLPVFILGPCVMESEDFVWELARALKELTTGQGVPFVFKASYDKANRTSISSYRGMGCEEGCALLAEVGKELGVPVTTDVHSPEEARIAGGLVDILQIPAFLCRQTDLIVAAAETGRVINVKKGQFLAPWDVKNIAEKIQASGNDRFFFTERGSSFGYNTLVADMRSLYWMRAQGYRVVFDATHSVQRPGGLGGTSGGDGILAPVLARAAVAAGCDGVFIETHFDPSKSLSDGPNMVPFAKLPAVVQKLKALHILANT